MPARQSPTKPSEGLPAGSQSWAGSYAAAANICVTQEGGSLWFWWKCHGGGGVTLVCYRIQGFDNQEVVPGCLCPLPSSGQTVFTCCVFLYIFVHQSGVKEAEVHMLETRK